LQDLMMIRIDVRNHSQMLQSLWLQILAFIDDEQGPAAAGNLTVKIILQAFEQSWIIALKWAIERHHDPLQQLLASLRGVRDQTDRDIGREPFEEVPNQRRLARSNLARNHRKAGVVHDAELQHGKRHT